MKIISIRFLEESTFAVIYEITYKDWYWFKLKTFTKKVIIEKEWGARGFHHFAKSYEDGHSMGGSFMGSHISDICVHDFKLNHQNK